MTSHWGEIPIVQESDPATAAIEREQMTKLRPMELEGPRLHQPSSRHYPPTNEPLPAEKFQIDPIVLHTIQLLQHARRLRSLKNNLLQHQQQLQQDKIIDFDTTYPDAPPIPEYSGPPAVKQKLLHPVPFMNKDMESDFVLGKSEPLPQIDDVACRHLLRRSVAAILAHAGFDSCAESILETMTDFTGEYFTQFTRHLRAAADNLAGHESTGFPDIVEQVFQEMKVGSVTCLHDFYHKRVINYHKNMEEQCQQLDEEYEKLKEPMLQQKPPDTLSVIRIKEEPSEIHFPELDEIDEVNNAEQLLNLNDLGGFEITVEHESASGLTTEVESKWSHVKAEHGDPKVVNLDNFDESGTAIKDEPPSVSSSDADDSMHDPPSITVADIMSPTSLPSKAKKKKK
ncbi:STAGA complex 65 subunit gamma-like isoform X2 [Ruditapes philippinarum]|nr:STAGA complex 65 subunit gamma-like isoform X2 [Ruditapes philippinarum]XP_060603180.1 STAGA complex 65 subunit gamma-like isoform X2 [Ruditapes philippinarum]